VVAAASGAGTGDPLRAAVVTISTSKARGEGEDESGRRLSELASRMGAEVVGPEVIPDDRALIEERLRFLADEERCDLVLTTGGTGFSPSDVTPEATLAVIERHAPGIGEAMRAASRDHTRHWMLSRGLAGIRGSTLIVNFPGSPASIEQAGEAIAEALPHALDQIGGGGAHRSPDMAPGGRASER
jgi:molybdopterin adenylyltransferase